MAERHMNHRNHNTGFTLIELITVFAIISFLAAMLLSAVNVSRNRGRIVAATSEVKNLETAWKQYYSRYHRWPGPATNEDEALAIAGDLARILHGENVDGDNAGNVKFIEFQRCNSQSNPVNPWAESGMGSGGSYYYVKFDVDFDNVIRAGTTSPPTNDIRRSVIVWTTNTGAGTILGSWQ